MRFLRPALFITTVLAAAACGQRDEADAPDGGGRVLAVVNGVSITEQDFVRRVSSGGPSSVARAKTQAGRKAMLEQMIRTELLWQEAQKRGIRGDRTVRDSVNPMLVKRFLAKEFEKTVTIDQVQDSEVERIYRDRWDEFHFPEVWRLGAMKLRDRPAANKMMKRLADGNNDEDVFEILATGPENLDDRLRANEGNIGYLQLDKLREAIPPHLRPHFERIKDTDEKPEIVEVPEGTYVLMMTGHRQPMVRELDEVRQGLRQQAFRELREKRLNELVASFRPRHDVATHYDRLDFVHIEEPRRPPSRRSPDGGTATTGTDGGTASAGADGGTASAGAG
ncbi:MAG: SurA N-terminal domain-containing protein, partial [Deltaproteobacteria bacterium]|nr:SurA N-terminal domain-containing protein [Deltaproteobacteria bacterium]